ncbi:hypothetical protein [Brachyspira intermedia]|uniref:hypothetical protein n=1 Tax=Brachyspira intermedia TaxID=84377 RepID=UPI0030041CBC
MGKGHILEGKTTEAGGLMSQDTDGGIEHTRSGTTNEPDGGVDYIRKINKNKIENYKAYIENLKKGKK